MNYWYFIEPCDVWMFRDSKPFAAGQSFVARSQFPPTPQVMQGVVRSNYLEAQGVDWASYKRESDAGQTWLVGNAHDLGKFQQFGPLAGRRVTGETGKERIELLIPAPLDVVKSKSDEAAAPMVLAPSSESFRTDAPFAGWRPLAAAAHSDDLERASGWMGEGDLKRYLNGQAPVSLLTPESLFQFEEKVGLAMDHGRRTHRDKHLYHAQFVRLAAKVGLVVGVNEPYLDGQPIINIGGESRSGYCEAMHVVLPAGRKAGRIKVALLTPAYFSGGWQPEGGDWSRWVGSGTLVSTAIGRPQPISGWDVANNRAKPLNQYVPAGSVYYFENADWQDIPFTETPDGMLDHAAIGFGGALTASWTPVTNEEN